jgi:hypothetical protein
MIILYTQRYHFFYQQIHFIRFFKNSFLVYAERQHFIISMILVFLFEYLFYRAMVSHLLANGFYLLEFGFKLLANK